MLDPRAYDVFCAHQDRSVLWDFWQFQPALDYTTLWRNVVRQSRIWGNKKESGVLTSAFDQARRSQDRLNGVCTIHRYFVWSYNNRSAHQKRPNKHFILRQTNANNVPIALVQGPIVRVLFSCAKNVGHPQFGESVDDRSGIPCEGVEGRETV